MAHLSAVTHPSSNHLNTRPVHCKSDTIRLLHQATGSLAQCAVDKFFSAKFQSIELHLCPFSIFDCFIDSEAHRDRD